MGREAEAAVVKRIEDADQFDELVAESQSKLVVIDLFAEWCGPCSALTPTMNKMMVDYDRSEDRIVLATACIDKLHEKIQAALPTDTQVKLETNGCHPVFAVFRFGAVIGMVTGADSPALLSLVDINIPAAPAAAAAAE